MARRRDLDPLDPLADKSVTFRPDPGTDGYGVIDCSWEEGSRDSAISLEAAKKFAEGWQAEFKVEAAW